MIIMTMKFLLSMIKVTVTITYPPSLIAVTRTILFTVILQLKNNVHDHSVINNLHDYNLPSMRAHSMLNLGLKKKGFKMENLNIQGI